jgi:hypothetical protein
MNINNNSNSDVALARAGVQGKLVQVLQSDIKNISMTRYNREKTSYSQPILNTRHERAFDTTSLDIMEVYTKGPYLNALERYHIYQSKKEELINELQYDTYNPIFDIINYSHYIS